MSWMRIRRCWGRCCSGCGEAVQCCDDVWYTDQEISLNTISFLGENMHRLLVCITCLVMVNSAITARAQILDPIDYSDQPQLLATLPIPAGNASEVVTLGHVAYVLVEGFGFVVVDWLDPDAPLAGMEVPFNSGVRSLAVGNDALYVLDGQGQLELFDLADPLAPYSLGQISGVAEANDLCIRGDFAYFVLASGGLQVVDLADPLVPVAGVQVALDNGNQSVAVFEDRAYVVGFNDDSSFHVVDLTDPSQPMVLGSFNVNEHHHLYFMEVFAGVGGVFVMGNAWIWPDYFEDPYDYYHSRFLRPIDVTNPTDPQLGERLFSPDSHTFSERNLDLFAIPLDGLLMVSAATAVVVGPDCAQCDSHRNHLFIQEYGTPDDARRIYDIPLPAAPSSMIWSDGHLLVTCREAGLSIVSAPMLAPDYSEPLTPVYPQHAVSGMEACLSGDRLATFYSYACFEFYWEIWFNSLSVFNIVNGVPQLEDSIGSQDMYFMKSMVLVGEDLLYSNGQIFRLNDGITSLGFFGEDGRTFQFITQASGYLVGYQRLSSYQNYWLRTWNIGNPEVPVLVDQWETDFTGMRNLESYEDHVFLVTSTNVEIFRITPNGLITPVGSFTPPFSPSSLACNGTLLAVGGTQGELYLYPANNTENPTPLAQLNLGEKIVDLEFGTQLYASVQEFGWAVVDVSPGDQPHVDGWIHGAEPRCAKADGDNLVLVNTCPRTTYVTRQASSSTAIAVPDQAPVIPRDFGLIRIEDAWPNPANPRISVAFELSRAATVEAEVIDLAGRRVATLAVGPRPAGRHVLQWDGRGDAGRDQASGVYLIRVHAGSESAVRKVLLAR